MVPQTRSIARGNPHRNIARRAGPFVPSAHSNGQLTVIPSRNDSPVEYTAKQKALRKPKPKPNIATNGPPNTLLLAPITSGRGTY